jgi:hypothetical protein
VFTSELRTPTGLILFCRYSLTVVSVFCYIPLRFVLSVRALIRYVALFTGSPLLRFITAKSFNGMILLALTSKFLTDVFYITNLLSERESQAIIRQNLKNHVWPFIKRNYFKIQLNETKINSFSNIVFSRLLSKICFRIRSVSVE